MIALAYFGSLSASIIAIEKKEPYRCGVWQLLQETLDNARGENRAANHSNIIYYRQVISRLQDRANSSFCQKNGAGEITLFVPRGWPTFPNPSNFARLGNFFSSATRANVTAQAWGRFGHTQNVKTVKQSNTGIVRPLAKLSFPNNAKQLILGTLEFLSVPFSTPR